MTRMDLIESALITFGVFALVIALAPVWRPAALRALLVLCDLSARRVDTEPQPIRSARPGARAVEIDGQIWLNG